MPKRLPTSYAWMLIILGAGCALSSMLQIKSVLMVPAGVCLVAGAVYGLVAWRVNAKAVETARLDAASSAPILGLTSEEEN